MEVKEQLEVYKDVYVVSKYIETPLLLGGRKFDLRIYVFVNSFTPLRVFIYRGGFCRLSSERFNLDKQHMKDLTVHLTNIAVQRRQELNECTSSNMKWSLHSLRVHLSTQYGEQKTNDLFGKINDIIIRSLLCVQHVVTQDKHCFEVYGYDILIDDALKPWLIEVNASPSLQTDSKEDFELKFNMVNDAFSLLNMENNHQETTTQTQGG